MSDHERCACGRMPTLMDVQGYALWVVRCGGPAVLSPMNCWCGPSAITPKGAWEQWDRVMRADRLAIEGRILPIVKDLGSLEFKDDLDDEEAPR